MINFIIFLVVDERVEVVLRIEVDRIFGVYIVNIERVRI